MRVSLDLVALFIALIFVPHFSAFLADDEEIPDSFRKFTSRVFHDSNEFFTSALNTSGVGIMSPFGVGLMLANIHDQVWNVSNDGISNFLSVVATQEDKVVCDYAVLLKKFRREKMTIENVLFVPPKTPLKLPPGSEKMKTEVLRSDFHGDWESSWNLMQGMVAFHTGGKISDFLPGYHEGLQVFDSSTVAAYINTAHFKWDWEQKFTPIGKKNFTDGSLVNFLQMEGHFPMRETEKYIAVAIPLKEIGKYFVFIRPNGRDFSPFLNDNLPCPSLWRLSRAKKTVQVPSFRFTVHDRHYQQLKKYIPNTFCQQTRGRRRSYRKPFFVRPIVQTHHVHLTQDFFEVASATGATINSEEVTVARIKVDSSSRRNLPLPEVHQYPPECDSDDENLIQFNRPFYWYFYDVDTTTPLYHGAVKSFAQRKRMHDMMGHYGTDLWKYWVCGDNILAR